MQSLPEQQRVLLDALLGRSDARAAAQLLRQGPGLPAARRLQVYRHNLQGSLCGALAAVYPVVARLVGAAFFDKLACRYGDAHPARSGNLQDCGGGFAAFVAATPTGLPYLADVAKLEWAYHEVWHEADPLAFDHAALAALPAALRPHLRLQLQAATRFIASSYPVLRIWQLNQPDANDDTALSLAEGGVSLLVARQGFDVEFRLLAPAEALWLQSLHAGASLARASAAALDVDAAFDLPAVLARHLALGSFADWSLADDAEQP
jgi:hypothetical protein